MHELLRFPAGIHDDMVDTLSLIGRMMDNMAAAPEIERPSDFSLVPTTMGEIFEQHMRRRKGRTVRSGIVMG